MPLKLNIAVLTTDTAHHRFFLRELNRELPKEARVVMTLFEERPYPMRRKRLKHIYTNFSNPWKALVENPYIQPKSFTLRQAAFERPRFFPGNDDSLPSHVESHRVWSVNNDQSQSIIDRVSPDLILVYGTGLVKKKIFGKPPLGTVNAHGGKLPNYRGLDTNLWAAFEGRPQDMMLTLHQMDETFDTGPVYASRPILPNGELSIYSLRYFTALICTQMYLDLVESFIAGTATATPQSDAPSRYYSLMPWAFKRRVNRVLRTYA